MTLAAGGVQTTWDWGGLVRGFRRCGREGRRTRSAPGGWVLV